MRRLNLVLTLAVVMGFAETAAAVPAQELLDDVIRQLPREYLIISGDITVRKRRGVVTQDMQFEMRADWGGNPASVEYIIRDSFGANLERMKVTRAGNNPPTFEYARGKDLVTATCPNLREQVQGTDMSWIDLTMGFLWWRDGKVIGQEDVRGRMCHVVEIPAPTADDGPYGKVVLWIDERLHVMLQAEGYGRGTEIVRRLWVKGFKKIDDRWMIKDLEIESYPATHRTRLRIREAGADTRP